MCTFRAPHLMLARAPCLLRKRTVVQDTWTTQCVNWHPPPPCSALFVVTHTTYHHTHFYSGMAGNGRYPPGCPSTVKLCVSALTDMATYHVLSSPFKANNVHGMAVRYTSLKACRCLRNHTSTLPAGHLHAWGHTLYMHGDCMHGNCMHGDCLCGNGDCVHGDWQLGTLMIHQRVTGEGVTGEGVTGEE